uniref:Uncharacterized protein n=1 Tax=Megaselia scalaris TaxID=36166 RepID=T1GU94_MEGSC
MGCQATNQKKRCLLGLFCALLVIFICIQFILCGWALAMRENIPTNMEIYVDDSFVEFLDKFSRTKVDNLHYGILQCCGVDGPLDYRRLSLPWSCCSRPEHAYESACDTHYKRGCLAVLTEQIKIRLLLACFAAAGIALAQSIGVFCAIHLTVLLGRCDSGDDINRIARRQNDFIPLSIQDKRRDISSPPLSLSPSAPGHRLMKTAPPPIPTQPK